MVVAGITVALLAVGAIWYVVVRGRDAEFVSERDFDAAYDERVHAGDEPDRDDAWRDFNAWQMRSEAEHRSWEEDDDA
jgi:hypothetical protein